MDLMKVKLLLLTTGPNVNGLKSFFQGDAIYVISVVCGLIIAKNWKEANWLKIGSVLVVYAIVVSLFKGQQLLSFLGGILRWFGIETGL